MKALIAMSGGVDSSVAALLVKQRGYDVVGCTMKLFDNEDAGIPRDHTCCSLADVEDARMVAWKLDIPYYVFNFKEAFAERVIEPFIRSYQNGETPNPCIECNRHLKFAKLYERAVILECDTVVTGHYARVERTGDRYVLKKALDPTKDQSYVLYSMTQKQLSRMQFPLGELTKTEVRRLAEQNGLVTADKPDSQDICFVPDGDCAAVIERMTGQVSRPGDFVDAAGHVIGRHRGIIHYTVGQRKGLGIASERPWYVCRLSPRDNTAVLGRYEELFSTHVPVRACTWVSGDPPQEPFRCHAKLRYRQPEQPATAYPRVDGTVVLEFDAPQRAVTPGQAAVLYDGDVVLGGGVIACEAE